MIQAGQLLIVRKHLTLAEGITTVDTGITQQNLGVSPDPPLSGSDPTATEAGVASRVMVVPMAPLPPWNTGNIHHGEPYVDAATGTVQVDFWVTAGAGAQEINVEFWDPHTEVCPVDAEVYATFACVQPAYLNESGSGPNGHVDSLDLSNAGTGFPVGSGLVAAVVVRTTDNFNDPLAAPVADDAGWTLLRRGSISLGGDDGIHVAFFFRLSTAADPATWGFSWAPSANGGGAIMYAFGPVDPVDPVVADAAVTLQAAPETPLAVDAPSLTLDTPLSMLFGFWVADVAYPPFFTLSSATMEANKGSVRNTGALPGLQMAGSYEGVAAAGATGVRTGTLAATTASGMAYAVAFRQACGIFPDGSGGNG